MVQPIHDNPCPVLAWVVLWFGDVGRLEVGPEVVQVDLDADPLGIALSSRENPSALAEPCSGDVEPHAEEAELVEAVIARPAGFHRLLQDVAGHPATSVCHDDLCAREASARSRQRHAYLVAAGPSLTRA